MNFDNDSDLANIIMWWKYESDILEDYIAAVKMIDFGRENTGSKGIDNRIIAFALCC